MGKPAYLALPKVVATSCDRRNAPADVVRLASGTWRLVDAVVSPGSSYVARYNINVRTDSHIATTVAIEKDSHTDLRMEMARFVGELLKDHADLIWADEDWQVDVSDESGLILYVLQVIASKTAATTHEQNGHHSS